MAILMKQILLNTPTGLIIISSNCLVILINQANFLSDTRENLLTQKMVLYPRALLWGIIPNLFKNVYKLR